MPLRLHLASGQKISINYPNSAFVRRNTLLVVHRLERGTSAIGGYEVIALPLIERIEQGNDTNGSKKHAKRRSS